MKEFDDLLHVLDRLLGPGGCPWDQKQTLHTMRASPLEEVHELIEAIDSDDEKAIGEELGDLFFNACFLGRLAEKEKGLLLPEILHGIAEKLIRRHPHVFGEKVVKDAEGVVKQWEEIKDTEHGGKRRENPFHGIPKALPALAKAQKVCKKLTKLGIAVDKDKAEFCNEDTLGELLLSIAARAQAEGLDAEVALHRVLNKHMKEAQTKDTRT